MEPYRDLLRDVLRNGEQEPTRAILKSTNQPVDALRVFGRQVRYDLAKGFPAVTCKKLFLRGVFEELFFFLSGKTDNNILRAKNVHIWDEWEKDGGELGPIYSFQWRRWGEQSEVGGSGERHILKPGIDQISNVIAELRKNPSSRRAVVSAWNVSDLPKMALPPCHCLFQFTIIKNKLSCQLYQRSADIFLGVPFNIASYAALTHIIAAAVGCELGDFIHTFGDLHLYVNHREQAELFLSREPYPLPTLHIRPGAADIFQLTTNDVFVENYQSHPPIAAEVAV